MTEFYLDENNDIAFTEDGDIILIDGIEETSQNSRFRLQIQRGECFEDESIGIPWITDMVDPRVSIDAKKQILRREILGAPNVLTLDELTVATDTVGALAISTFKGTSTDGQFTG